MLKTEQFSIIVPDDAQILDIARQAIASHLYLITDGQRSLLSPVVLNGYRLQMDPASRKAQQLLQVAA